MTDNDNSRLQVLTPKGVLLQMLNFGTVSLRGVCADEQRVWVVDALRDRVSVLKVN